MRAAIILFGLILLGLVGFEIYTNSAFAQRTAKFRLIVETANNLGVELESTLGYGGLIHNFKNAVLRPGEPIYIETAAREAQRAQVIIEKLETLFADLTIEPDLSAVKDMVQGYQRNIARLPELHAQTSDVAAVDALVRYDDKAAINATKTAIGLINSEVRRTFDDLENAALVQNLAGAAIGIAALSMLFVYSLRRNQLMNLKALSAANTELEAANTNLDRSNVALKQFAGIVSHDLRAPIRTVSMFIHAIADEKNDAETVDEYTQMALEITGKMDELIGSLLDFTKNGFQKPKLDRVSLNTLIGAIASDIGLTTHGAGPNLTCAVLPDLKCDRVLMSRVIENLLSNSKKYCNASNALQISITADIEQDAIAISFADNGIGIEPQYSDRIFEPLQRLHGDDSPYDGVGIGLALVKSIVVAHGGSIALDTTYEGGACFVLRLPKSLVVAGNAADELSAAA